MTAWKSTVTLWGSSRNRTDLCTEFSFQPTFNPSQIHKWPLFKFLKFRLKARFVGQDGGIFRMKLLMNIVRDIELIFGQLITHDKIKLV